MCAFSFPQQGHLLLRHCDKENAKTQAFRYPGMAPAKASDHDLAWPGLCLGISLGLWAACLSCLFLKHWAASLCYVSAFTVAAGTEPPSNSYLWPSTVYHLELCFS
jgi:hypothetical protein